MADMDHWPPYLIEHAEMAERKLKSQIKRLGLTGDAEATFRAMSERQRVNLIAGLLRVHSLVTPGMVQYAARNDLIPMVGNPK